MFINFQKEERQSVDFVSEITPLSKNDILKSLIDRGYNIGSIDSAKECEKFNMSAESYILIMNSLIKSGFIIKKGNLYSTTFNDLFLEESAIFFFSKGGFIAEQTLREARLEKLMLDIEKLQSTFPDKASFYASIAANVAAVIGMFNGK